MKSEKSILTQPEEVISKASHKIYLTDTHAEIVKDFLYKLYLRDLTDDNINVQKALGIKNNLDPATTLPNLNLNEKNGIYTFFQSVINKKTTNLYFRQHFNLC